MTEAPSERHFTKRKLSAIGALVFGLFVTYRVFGVYTIRFGTCDFPITPAEPVRAGAPKYPPRLPAARAARSLVVMSYNAEGHAALFREDHLQRLAEVIVAQQADIVGLQEIHRGTWQARFRDQAMELARLTGMNAYFGPSFTIFGGQYGNAVLTRGRIVQARVFNLPSVGEPRSLLQATIDIDGSRMNFFVTHLASWGKINRKSRLEQIQCIAEHVRRSTLPYIVVGDFNATPATPEFQWFRHSALVYLCGETGVSTHRLTGQQLDYIFADPGWQLRSGRVLLSGPSDHWPLLAEIEWSQKDAGS